MRALPTTRVSILRGESTNIFADVTDASTVITVGVPIAITETGRATTSHADDRQKSVLTYTGRCSPKIDVRQGDRLLDKDGVTYYSVRAVTTVSNPITGNDQRLDLERVPTS